MLSILILAPVGIPTLYFAYRLVVFKLTPIGPDEGRQALLKLNPFLEKTVQDRLATGRPVGHLLIE